MRLRDALALLATLAFVPACSSGDDAEPATSQIDPALEAKVVETYAKLVSASCAETLAKAKAMQTAIDGFVASPSDATMKAAKDAWLAARPVYGQTEAFRFYGGPIDADDTGPEGRINAWPLDEAYIDYVEGNADAGIVNDTSKAITKALLVELNEKDGEANIATGWHAIEFLLWGQDRSATGPGDRPFTDYVEGGTAKNQTRRATYLKVVTELLVDDLASVAKAWDLADPASYGSAFVTGKTESVTKILRGIGALSATELPRERINNAYENKDQEEEHSCFSDDTHVDIAANLQGIENVYLGTFGAIAGPGIGDLVKAEDPKLDADVRAKLAAAKAAVQAIPAPFDQAILGDDAAPGRVKVKAAIDAIKAVSDGVVDVATKLGVKINVDID